MTEYKRCKRVHRVEYLDEGYAPDGVAGEYHVLTQYCSWFCNEWTVIGHIIKMPDGKMRRVWMS